MKEEWRDIKGYEGLYAVSNFGRVKSLGRYEHGHIRHGVKNATFYRKEYVMKQEVSNNGYHRIMLCKLGKKNKHLVHRLVAFAFPEICGEWFDGAICNHKDENKNNNKATNIEWCTYSYNNRYNNKNTKIGDKQGKIVLQYSINNEFIKEWKSASFAGKELGFSHSHISSCCRGERKSHKGFIWRYK